MWHEEFLCSVGDNNNKNNFIIYIMKHKYVILTTAIMLQMACGAMAQQRISGVVGDSFSLSFGYDDAGLLTKVQHEGTPLLPFANEENYNEWKSSFFGDVYRQTTCFTDQNNYDWGYFKDAKMSDGLILSEEHFNDFKFSNGKSFDYSYDSESRMTSVTIDFSDPVQLVFEWDGCDLTGGEIISGGERVGNFTCTYDERQTAANRILCSPLLLFLTYYHVIPLGGLANGYYGQTGEHLLMSLHIETDDEFHAEHSDVQNDISYLPFVRSAQWELSYTLDEGNGQVCAFSVSDGDKTSDFAVEYESVATGITSVLTERGWHGGTTLSDGCTYDLQGRRQAGASHGVSIVRGADGSVRKLMRR